VLENKKMFHFSNWTNSV